MKTMTKSLLLAALGAASLTLAAQDAPADGAANHPRRGAPPLVSTLDANHDGVIDASEIASASAALAALDTNGDGQITPDEARPARPDRGDRPARPEGTEVRKQRGPGGPGGKGGPEGGQRGPGSPLMAALDANQDHVIDASEIANAPAVLVTLDANGDGQVSGDEMRPGRPAGAPQGGKGRGGKGGQRPAAGGQ